MDANVLEERGASAFMAEECPEYGGHTFYMKMGIYLPSYTASHPRKKQSL
jgi:hypothetical protein